MIQRFKPTCRRKTTLHPEAEAGLQPGARKNAAGSAPVIQGPVRGSLGFASLFEELAGPLRPGPGKPKPEAAAGGVSPWRATTARVFSGGCRAAVALRKAAKSFGATLKFDETLQRCLQAQSEGPLDPKPLQAQDLLLKRHL